MPKQGKKGSLIESIVQVVIGWFVGVLTQLAVYPMLGIEVSLSQNMTISLIFIAVSLIKQYSVRRGFALYLNSNE